MPFEPERDEILSARLEEVFKRLGVDPARSSSGLITVDNRQVRTLQSEIVFNELVELVVACYNLERQLEEKNSQLAGLAEFVDSLIKIVMDAADFQEIDGLAKNIALYLMDLIELENVSVLQTQDGAPVLRFQVGSVQLPFSMSDEKRFESYILNGVDLVINCCDVTDTFFRHLCERGVYHVRVLARSKEDLGLLGIFGSRKPFDPAATHFVKIAFDFIFFAYQFNKYETQIKKHTAHLEGLVAERTLHLEVEKKKAEEANMAKSRFISNMSHELRTPLTAIVGYTSILKDGLFGPLSSEQMEAISSISQASEHLKQLIDDVLNLARIETGKDVPKTEHIPVQELESVVKLMKTNADKKNITLTVENTDESFYRSFVQADRKHFRQIMLNLISNAIKYTPEGGQVTVRASKLADKVKLEVIDTGIGISDELKQKLFERFERGQDEYSQSQEGTGIGLSITKALVELNGGIIGVESELGKGSNFWVLLPQSTVNQADVCVPANEEIISSLENVRILLVEDEKISFELLKKLFSKLGAQVTHCSTVAQALEQLHNLVPDLIVTDIGLVGHRSGLDLVQTVRAELKLRIPILVLSASSDPKTVETAIRLGANDFVQKPFSPNQLVKRVTQILRQFLLT
ncbi:MAG: ATP-binding protein [Thermoplasmatales archaeon]